MFEKISRIVIILLLAGILSVQLYSVFYTPEPSKECLAAIDEAAALVGLMSPKLKDSLNDYNKQAYDVSKNINQQIFSAGEASLIAITLMTTYTEDLLKIQTACR